jgi:protein O-GlcNAc transferase
MRPGRNGPCPCGSGRRYKHCCGALGATAAEESARPLDIGALVVLIEQDRPAEAEHHAQLLLQGSPDSGRLWKILSVALMRQGKDALPALRRAAELLPDDAQLLIAAGNALCTGGRARESLALFQRAIEIDPRSSEAHNNLGNALQELGECAAAVGCYRQALAISPDDAETHCNLSNALRRLRQLPEAIACSERAIALAPGLSIAHNNLGLALAALPASRGTEPALRGGAEQSRQRAGGAW